MLTPQKMINTYCNNFCRKLCPHYIVCTIISNLLNDRILADISTLNIMLQIGATHNLTQKILNSVSDLNSNFSDLYTSMKDVFVVINAFTGTVSASTPLSTQIRFVFVII